MQGTQNDQQSSGSGATRKRVILRNVFEYDEDYVEDHTDEELIEDAREAFYLDGAEVSATVEEVRR